MGTRHLICVYSEGEYKVAQYGQWDGYPQGQGAEILRFLKEAGNIELLKEKVKLCRWITRSELKKRWGDFGVDIDSTSLISIDVADEFYGEYPELSRDTGAQILQYIIDSQEGLKLKDDYNFSADSLFCEWAYVIDLDKGTFEVYEGFNEEPIEETERFYTDDIVTYSDPEVKYYPVKQVASFSLDSLPEKEDFYKKCGIPEDLY